MAIFSLLPFWLLLQLHSEQLHYVHPGFLQHSDSCSLPAKSISIKPKNTEVVVEGGVPDVPLPVPFPEPINSVALIVQGMINSMIRPEKTLRLYENFFIGMIFNSLR